MGNFQIFVSLHNFYINFENFDDNQIKKFWSLEKNWERNIFNVKKITSRIFTRGFILDKAWFCPYYSLEKTAVQ